MSFCYVIEALSFANLFPVLAIVFLIIFFLAFGVLSSVFSEVLASIWFLLRYVSFQHQYM